jgi:endonuclease/exonuclease/phosphatase family metal-dependent hydrolase
MRLCLLLIVSLLSASSAAAQRLTLVELNCENLFDTKHDSLKQDQEYLPDALRRWTDRRYWRKLNHTAQTILSACDDGIPDMVALCEVENDTVMRDLTRRSLLRNAAYEYIMTNSPDVRGIDVALLYSPFSFQLLAAYPLRVVPCRNDMRPTRDMLYACGRTADGDTLHVFVVHAPSRYGGELHSRPFRLCVAERLALSVDSIYALHPRARIVVAGDFNDFDNAPALKLITSHRLSDIALQASAPDGIRGTYRYQGDWNLLDHIFVSPALYNKVDSVCIHAPRFLLEDEPLYGGYRPRRTYNGPRYQRGYSDHLPLVARFNLGGAQPLPSQSPSHKEAQ